VERLLRRSHDQPAWWNRIAVQRVIPQRIDFAEQPNRQAAALTVLVAEDLVLLVRANRKIPCDAFERGIDTFEGLPFRRIFSLPSFPKADQGAFLRGSQNGFRA
jgi:hypothetical protein